jgi:predicted nucleotidyltransferase
MQASVLLTEQERRLIEAFVDKVRARFDQQLVSMILFGSRARGEASPDSDMDIAVILIEVNADTRQVIRNLAVEVWLETGIYLSTRVWSQRHWVTMAELQTSLYLNIAREGLELFPATAA